MRCKSIVYWLQRNQERSTIANGMKQVLPIFHVDSEGRVCCDGSGLIARIDGEFFFVTCHHILKDRPKESHFIVIEDKKVFLNEHGPLYHGKYEAIAPEDSVYVVDFGYQKLVSYGGDFLEFVHPCEIASETALILVSYEEDGSHIQIPCRKLNEELWLEAEANGKIVTLHNAVGIEELDSSSSKIVKGYSGGAVVVSSSNKCLGILKGQAKVQVKSGYFRDVPYFVSSDKIIEFMRDKKHV